MEKRIKDQWIKALTSGTYKQGQHRLKQTVNGRKVFCCLGVLCDIYGHEKNVPWDSASPADKIGNAETFLDERLFLPLKVIEWAGLGNIAQSILHFGDDESLTLDHANDTGFGFKEIAKVIKEQL